MMRILANILYPFIIFLNGDVWDLKKKIKSMKNGKLKTIYILIYEKRLGKMGSWIGWNSNIDSKPNFPHGISGIFISGGVTISKNCVIFQQVTIGSNSILNHPKNGSPTIGENCYIGAGAKIIGNITIGNNVRIGANCVVTKDVPDNCVVVLDNIKVIQKEGLDNKYYSKNGEDLYYMNEGTFVKV